MQGWVDLGGGYKIIYPPKRVTYLSNKPGSVLTGTRTRDGKSLLLCPNHYTTKPPFKQIPALRTCIVPASHILVLLVANSTQQHLTYRGFQIKMSKVFCTILLQPYVTQSCGFQQRCRVFVLSVDTAPFLLILENDLSANVVAITLP